MKVRGLCLSHKALSLFAVFACLALTARPDDFRFGDGRLRIELSGFGGVYSGKAERDDDSYATGSVEYEWPAYPHGTLALRAVPLFVYDQERHGANDGDTIWGVALGMGTRVYQREDHTGFFGETGAAALYTSGYFNENSSCLNFMLDVGVGYQFAEKPWHLRSNSSTYPTRTSAAITPG